MKIADISGKGNDATQDDPSKEPKLMPGETLEQVAKRQHEEDISQLHRVLIAFGAGKTILMIMLPRTETLSIVKVVHRKMIRRTVNRMVAETLDTLGATEAWIETPYWAGWWQRDPDRKSTPA
jgi:hypothetical protein